MNGETNTHHITLFFLCDTEWTWVTVKVYTDGTDCHAISIEKF